MHVNTETKTTAPSRHVELHQPPPFSTYFTQRKTNGNDQLPLLPRSKPMQPQHHRTTNLPHTNDHQNNQQPNRAQNYHTNTTQRHKRTYGYYLHPSPLIFSLLWFVDVHRGNRWDRPMYINEPLRPVSTTSPFPSIVTFVGTQEQNNHKIT